MTELERIRRNKELLATSNALHQAKYNNVSTTFEPMKKFEVKPSKEVQKELIKEVFNDDFLQRLRKSSEIPARVFASGSKRDANDDKPRISDMQPYTLKRFGYHMLIGSKNYGAGNFEKGQPTDSLLESLVRHINDYRLGDRSEDHLSAVLFGVMMIEQNEDREGVNADHFYTKWKERNEKSLIDRLMEGNNG